MEFRICSLENLEMKLQKFFANKKVLITGHTGFKGSWLTQILIDFDADVVGVSLPPGTFPTLFEILELEKKTKTYYQDIREYDKIKKIFLKEKPEIVFHLAAQPIVRDSYDDPLYTIQTNVLGTANILQAIRETKTVKSAIIVTTDKVYENKEWVHPYREVDKLGGYDPYSASKAAADIITNSYIQSFFNPNDFSKTHSTLVAITRAGNVIGGGDWGNQRLLTDLIRSVYEKDGQIIIRSPNAIRPWQHVLEPLSGYMLLAKRLYQRKKKFVGAWNFGPGSDNFITVSKLVKAAIKILGKGKLIIEKDNSKHEANILKLDINKANSLLGWKPKLSLSHTLNLTFDWYRTFYERPAEIRKLTHDQIGNFLK